MSEKSQPLVSLITVTFNQTATTCELLESCKQLRYENLEVIVVDNGSESDPSPEILAHFPTAQIIHSESNLGYGGGINLGMRNASGAYYLILNNDIEVTDDLIEFLLEPFQENTTVGIVSPKIRYFPEAHMIQYAGYSKINPYTGRNKAIGQGENDRNQHDIEGFTAYAHGAAMMVSKEVVEEVGPIPEDYFLYYEELDWSEQVKRTGYNVFFQPTALVFHKTSSSNGNESPEQVYYYHRNRILYMRRNVNFFQLFIFQLYYLLVVLPKTIGTFLIARQWSQISATFRAIGWHLMRPRLNSQKRKSEVVVLSRTNGEQAAKSLTQ